jgi:molybdate transport system permease protein
VRALFAALLAVATGIALAFLLLPIAAIFLRVPPGDLVGALGHNVTRDALLVSIETSAIAHAAVLLIGTPAAYLLARRRFRGRGVVLTLIELPLVLPPAVAGIALFAAFGRMGLLGDELDALGVQIPFTQAAVVLAVAFVESPFYFRGAIAAFEAVDGTLVDAARTLGAGPARVFLRVALPLAAGGLGAASALALARGLGEFGATIIFAGSVRGQTQTLTLGIYEVLDSDFDQAIAIGIVLVILSATVLLSYKLILSWRSSTSTSPSVFARTS